MLDLLLLNEITVAALRDTILRELEYLCLSINDGHDKVPNMVWVDLGVKAWILAINPRAFVALCGWLSQLESWCDDSSTTS
jgi:hypothetical protein